MCTFASPSENEGRNKKKFIDNTERDNEVKMKISLKQIRVFFEL